jgi:Cu/Ag efflux protein CusF
MRLVCGVLVLVVGLGVTAFATADDKADKKAARKGTPGLVEKFDNASKTLTIRTGKKNDPNAATMTFTLSADTKITLQDQDGTKPGKIEDVASAKRVLVRKETRDGKEVVTEVIVVLGKKKAD